MKEKRCIKASSIGGGIAALLLIYGASGARGDMAAGSYGLSFGTNIYLWDLSGSYTDSPPGASIQYTINMDPAGKLTGTATGTFADETGEVDGYLNFTASLKGSVRSAGNVIRVSVTMKMAGSGELEGYDATFSGTLKESLELDPTTRQLIGNVRGSATVTVPGVGRKSGPLDPEPTETSLPADATGTWELMLNVSTNKTKYTGTGAVTLPSGRVFPLKTAGSYAAKTDISKFSLKGTGTNSPLSLSLSASVANGQMLLRKLNGKALGQTLRLTATP